MRSDDLPDDVEAETETLPTCSPSLLSVVERFEDPRNQLGRNGRPDIGNDQRDLIAFVPGDDEDRLPRLPVLHRVSDQIGSNFAQSGSVPHAATVTLGLEIDLTSRMRHLN